MLNSINTVYACPSLESNNRSVAWEVNLSLLDVPAAQLLQSARSPAQSVRNRGEKIRNHSVMIIIMKAQTVRLVIILLYLSQN